MENILHVLAIDDHVVVLEGYHSIFKSLEIAPYNQLKFTKANNCQTGHEAVVNNKVKPFDVAVVDYSIPQFAEKELHSGADVAMLIRKHMPECKIIMMTMHKEMDILARIIQKINPEGFINKSDCTTDELLMGFKKVMDGEIFYSRIISNYLKRVENGIVLEDIDIRILLLLSKGIRNKNLDKYIPLSASAIEKRKYKIKRLLDVKGDDEDLIDKARNQGYI